MIPFGTLVVQEFEKNCVVVFLVYFTLRERTNDYGVHFGFVKCLCKTFCTFLGRIFVTIVSVFLYHWYFSIHGFAAYCKWRVLI